MSPPVIEIRGVTKSFGELQVLGRDELAFQASYEIHPLWTLRVIVSQDVESPVNRHPEELFLQLHPQLLGLPHHLRVPHIDVSHDGLPFRVKGKGDDVGGSIPSQVLQIHLLNLIFPHEGQGDLTLRHILLRQRRYWPTCSDAVFSPPLRSA